MIREYWCSDCTYSTAIRDKTKYNFCPSYDIRSGVASHWKNTAALGSRATFHAERSTLSLQRVTMKDAATYTCRIDFRTNPTLTYTVNLTVIGKDNYAVVGPVLSCSFK